MPEESSPLNPEQAALEAQLAALIPQRGTLDPSALLFAAGRAAERSAVRRRRSLLIWSQPLWAAACLGLVWLHMSMSDVPQQSLPPASLAEVVDPSGQRAASRPTSYQARAAQPGSPASDTPMNFLRYRDEALAQALTTSLANPPARDHVQSVDQVASEEDLSSQSPSPLQLRRQMLDALLRL